MKKVFLDVINKKKNFSSELNSKVFLGNGGNRRVFSSSLSPDVALSTIFGGTAVFFTGCVIGGSLVKKEEEEKAKG